MSKQKEYDADEAWREQYEMSKHKPDWVKDAEIEEHLTALFNDGYGHGHNDTVEGCASHIVSGDEVEYQRDVAEQSEHYQTLLRAYRAEKERRESAERVVDAACEYRNNACSTAGIKAERNLYEFAEQHRAKYQTENDDE